jgi:ABC-type glycerol-3-phosphate transport system substrate-binding protein
VCALALLGSSCAFSATPEPAPTDVPQVPQEQQTRTPTPSLTVTPDSPRAPETLTVWIGDTVASPDGIELEILEQQLAAFEATHPGLTVDVQIKKAKGQGSVQDLLTKASTAATAVIPDLVALDSRTLPDVARKGLTIPLDGLISAGLETDMYPFALQAGTVDEQWMGAQFEARGLEHAIYNPNKIAVAPLTWTEVFSSGATYVFPAAGQDGIVNDSFLIQYLSTGAPLVDDSGNPALDPQVLTEVLDFYRQGIERGAILTDVLEYSTVEQCWPKFLQAEVVMSNISSDLYLSVLTEQVTSVPTRDGRAVMLSRGHSWAVTARDLERQTLALELLEWLLDPVNLTTWNRSAGHLPTRRAAFEQMERTFYVAFMYGQLESAMPYPMSETHERIYRAMQEALDAVLREGVPPESAAVGILEAVNQEISP